MTNVNHALSIEELDLISGGGLKSAFEKPPASTTTGGTGARRIGGNRFPAT